VSTTLSDAQREIIETSCAGFPLRVPRPFVARMRPGDLGDPLLLQALPQAAELVDTPNYREDPLEEASFTPMKGLLHKYHGRVLVVLSGSCAIHCRYCFRRHFPYDDFQIDKEAWKNILAYIAADNSIEEVILTHSTQPTPS